MGWCNTSLCTSCWCASCWHSHLSRSTRLWFLLPGTLQLLNIDKLHKKKKKKKGACGIDHRRKGLVRCYLRFQFLTGVDWLDNYMLLFKLIQWRWLEGVYICVVVRIAGLSLRFHSLFCFVYFRDLGCVGDSKIPAVLHPHYYIECGVAPCSP